MGLKNSKDGWPNKPECIIGSRYGKVISIDGSETFLVETAYPGKFPRDDVMVVMDAATKRKKYGVYLPTTTGTRVMREVLKYLRNRPDWRPLCRLECVMGSATVWELESSMPAKSHNGVNAVMAGRACDWPKVARGSETDADTGTHWESPRSQTYWISVDRPVLVTNGTEAQRLASLPVGRSALLITQRPIPRTRPIVETIDPLKIENHSLYQLMEEPTAGPAGRE